MAFCPNCGTPNTDQAEKCVACAFELGSKAKGKFKGTIMMSGVRTSGMQGAVKPSGQQPPVGSIPAGAPSAPPAAEAPPEDAPDVEPLPARPSVNSAFARNSSYAKTMLGHIAPDPELPELAPPSRSGAPRAPSTPSVSTPPRGASDMSSTLPGRAPSIAPAAEAGRGNTSVLPDVQLPLDASAWSSTPSLPIASRGPSPVDVSDRPPSPKGPSRMALIGCAGLLVVGVIVLALTYYGIAPMLARRGAQGTDEQARAWHAQLTQALTQVADLCSDDCRKAAVFFHESKQLALLGEAKSLTPQRVLALGDGAAKAEMLDRTDDAAIAGELALDPQQCVRVLRGTAKVISCSVPEAGGQAGVLRIVHLSGIAGL
ncbi:MAG: hypothetical protein ABW252_02390 [Polyangiales bacterium]